MSGPSMLASISILAKSVKLKCTFDFVPAMNSFHHCRHFPIMSRDARLIP
jgi:hypothetical protein